MVSFGSSFEVRLSRLIIIRRGQSLSNLKPWVPGEPYSDESDVLTPLGDRQAALAGSAIAGLGPRNQWELVCSTSTRARLTARRIAAATGHPGPIRFERGLKEKEDDEPFESVLVRAQAAIDAWRCPGDLVCVTHGHVIQSLVAAAIGVRADACTSLHPVNCAISIFLGRQLAVFNEWTHLRALSHEELFIHRLD